MLRPTSVKHFELKGFVGETSQVDIADVNRDGYMDIILLSGYWPPQDKTIPISILLNDKKGFFKNGKTIATGETVHPREMLVADFNGDGIKDIFIADHGYDAEPFPGYKNTLLLGKTGGGYTDASAKIPNRPEFTHSAAAADIDGDGDLDLYVGNTQAAESSPYFLINDGAANFTKSTGGLGLDILDGQNSYTTEVFFDADGDGDQDLFLGGEKAASRLLLNDGKGNFSPAPGTIPSGRFGVNKTSNIDASRFDFDKNGKDDILVVGVPDGSGAHLQVLLSTGTGGLVDETKLYFDSQPKTTGSIHYVHHVDINGDGALDILAEMWGGAVGITAYLNDGNNRFYHMRNDALVDVGGGALQVMDLNNDGKKELVQIGGSRGTLYFQIISLLTSKGDVKGTKGADTVFGDGSSQKISGGNGADFLAGGNGHDSLEGGSGNDKLLGGKGNDKIVGGVGNDVLVGSSGADKLTGGLGSDMFVFSSMKDSTATSADRDVISDFNRSQGDKIDLQTIDAVSSSRGNQAFSFIGTESFHNRAGELRYLKKAGDTFIFGDVNGDGKADFSIMLDTTVSLKASDFIL